MHRTTVAFAEKLFKRAKIKATAEGLNISEVLRILLTRWVRGEVSLEEPSESRRILVERAMSSFAMWRDRDPDTFLEESRAGLAVRDRELEDARMDSRQRRNH